MTLTILRGRFFAVCYCCGRRCCCCCSRRCFIAAVFTSFSSAAIRRDLCASGRPPIPHLSLSLSVIIPRVAVGPSPAAQPPVVRHTVVAAVASPVIETHVNKLCGRPPHYDAQGLQVDLWPFDLESGVRVTCDVGYLCANFSLPRPLCSRLRADVRDRQTERHQTRIIA